MDITSKYAIAATLAAIVLLLTLMVYRAVKQDKVEPRILAGLALVLILYGIALRLWADTHLISVMRGDTSLWRLAGLPTWMFLLPFWLAIGLIFVAMLRWGQLRLRFWQVRRARHANG